MHKRRRIPFVYVMARRQGIYWLGTIPRDDFFPYGPLRDGVQYIKGQLEVGADTGYEHWQILVVFSRKVSCHFVYSCFGNFHFELTRSEAAEDYVWKEETRVAGSQFELGERKMRRNVAADWENIRSLAKSGQLASIPADIYVRCYNQLSRIRVDHLVPVAIERTCFVFWGKTGTGKSRRAWEEGGMEAYAKDPCTKWWCGYQGQKNVIIDEFRGLIGISHLLRWLDRYPVFVETKGAAQPFLGERIWITSNVSPGAWYPELDSSTSDALMRRLQVIEFE